MIEWYEVTDDSNLPMRPHGQDSSTDRMLVYVKKEYAPNVFFGYYDYEEGYWSIEGINHLYQKGWKVTHWAIAPEGPSAPSNVELNQATVSDAPWNHRTSTP